MKYFLLILVVFSAVQSTSLSQARAQEVTGRIVDASTGEGLPSANIQVEGTYRGTVSNLDGYFRLAVPDLPAVLLVRYIGYETERVPVAEEGPFDITIRLQPVTYELEGVVVSGEDPAVRIMRQVIERKKQWRSQLQSYRASAYNRYTIANDTGIVMINETLTDAYWDRERGSREIIKSKRSTANVSFEDALPDDPYIINLYDDNLEIGNYRFVGVTHPSALAVYDFKLEGTRVRDSLAVFDISFRPKNRTDVAFVGHVAVLDSAFASLEAEVTPGESFLFPLPIKRYDVTLSQQFSNFGGDFWLPVDLRREAHLKFEWGILLSIPEIHLNQVSRLTDYEVNVAVPDSLYESEEYSIFDSASVAAAKMEAAAVVPLTTSEEVAFAGIDSTLTIRKAFKPRGLMASSIRFDEDERRGRFGLRFRPQLRRNRVEDWRVGLVAGREFGNLWLEGNAAYLTGPEEWSYGGAARFDIKQLELSAGYNRTFDPRSALWQEDQDPSNFAAVVTGSDQYDYFRNERGHVQTALSVPKLHSEIAVRFNREKHESFFVAGRSELTEEIEERVNPSIAEGVLSSVGVRLTVGDDVLAGVAGGNRIVLAAEHSDPSLTGGDFDFSHFSAMVDLRATTFHRRRFIPNTLDVRIVGGFSSGELPIQRTAVIDGSTLFLGPLHFSRFGNLRTLEQRVYQGDRYAGLFWEHSFRSVPFELIGWRWAARRGYSILVHGAHARSWLSERLKTEIGYPGAEPAGFHHEIGASLSGIFGLFRLDATQRLDRNDFTLGLSVAKIL